MAPLTSARLARTAAKAAGKTRLLLQPVARRRLGTRRAVQIKPPAQLRHLGAKTLDLARLRRYQRFDLRRKTHPTLESQSCALSPLSTPILDFLLPRDKNDSPRLGSY